DQRGQQIVGRGDGVEVAGEVQVDVLHRHHLGMAAAGGPALHAEAGAKAGLAQADDGLLADAIEAVAEADARRRLALAGRRRGDGGDQDQLAVRSVLQAFYELEGDLRLGRAVTIEMLVRNADLRSDLPDRPRLRGPGNLDIAAHL